MKPSADALLLLLSRVMEAAQKLDREATARGQGFCNGLHAGNVSTYGCPFCDARTVLDIHFTPKMKGTP
jgi:hypothetical protein